MLKLRVHDPLPGVLPETLSAWLALPHRVVSGGGTATEVRSISWHDRPYYLKVDLGSRWRKLLPRCVAGRCWCSTVALEARILKQLEAVGFPVIPIVCDGTEYRLGLPAGGIMVSRAVRGDSLEEALKRAHDEALWIRYGALCRELLRVGCKEPLRAKDVWIDDQGRWLLLDREKPLRRGRLSSRARRTYLHRLLYRNQRSGVMTAPDEIAAFHEGFDSAGAASALWPDRG